MWVLGVFGEWRIGGLGDWRIGRLECHASVRSLEALPAVGVLLVGASLVLAVTLAGTSKFSAKGFF